MFPPARLRTTSKEALGPKVSREPGPLRERIIIDDLRGAFRVGLLLPGVAMQFEDLLVQAGGVDHAHAEAACLPRRGTQGSAGRPATRVSESARATADRVRALHRLPSIPVGVPVGRAARCDSSAPAEKPPGASAVGERRYHGISTRGVADPQRGEIVLHHCDRLAERGLVGLGDGGRCARVVVGFPRGSLRLDH